ncbi:CubicO group peptidase (beta-lactamase class C family) [Allocatelliglobosispora scoriae]|uniref:CubicO group peptidase (Beta-lactamase class C family) n=1 Tax=Allocatelliglobosispora scoriae TaxID=643052 RepID=A0A841BMB9_9ACTN|nr:serine hydrolase domain-containing protein [Allocatelliglobosispora scoriae]MBB5868396.1 CubicO group peptidase (beta-lactamase class C family) [Allocatelliglobosispora scoriae]
MDADSLRGIGRRRLVGWGGAAAAGVVAAGVPLASAGIGHAASNAAGAAGHERIPPDARPGGAYDRYVAQLAAQDRFSGVVLLSHRGRTVLSRSYGMADREKGVRNHEGTAFSLSSAGKPFHAVALLQLAQQGRLTLTDTVGAHLTGFADDIATQVTIHHLLSNTSGLNTPDEDVRRVFQNRAEVREFYQQWARQSRLAAPVGTPTAHAGAEVAIPAMIVEAVTGTTYWEYVEENVFRRCGMTGSAFRTRPQWLTDRHIAHPYMMLADGSRVDALRNLDKDSPYVLGKNPGRAFIDAPGDGGFATAPDLVRFAHALGDGTALERPWADVLTAAKVPHGPTSFGAYGIPVRIVNGQWAFGRAGANPGIGAAWTIYPDTGWVGVILSNSDGAPLQEMSRRETQAVTGALPSGPGGGG